MSVPALATSSLESELDSALCYSSHSTLVQGYLEKGRITTNKRFFSLEGSALSYSDTQGGPTKLTLNLQKANVKFQDGKRLIYIFGKGVHPTSPSKEYYLTAQNKIDYLRWKSAIAKAISSASAKNEVVYANSFSLMLGEYRNSLRGAVERCMVDGTDDIGRVNVFDAARVTAAAVADMQTAPSEKALQQIWASSTTANEEKQKRINFAEHRAIVTQVLQEVRKDIAHYLEDFVAVVLKSHNIRGAEKEAKDLLTRNKKLQESIHEYAEQLVSHADQTAEDMWRQMDVDADGFATFEEFMTVYGNLQVVSPSLFMDIVQDEIGEQVDTIVSAKPVGQREGRCGLRNLGNTCYFNSAVQCVVHAPRFRKYIMFERYRKAKPDAKETPLCAAMKSLVDSMWLGMDRSVAPENVRSIMNKKTGFTFTARQQHDAHEMLSAVLDALHEELNVGQKAPYKELPDKPTKPDPEIADEWWDAYRCGNNSFIADIFHGQMRACVTCDECHERSLCFDPFATLILPLSSGSATRPAARPAQPLASDPAPALTVPANPLGRQQSTSIWDEVRQPSNNGSDVSSPTTSTMKREITHIEGVASPSHAHPPPRRPPVTIDECMSFLCSEEKLVDGDAVMCTRCKAMKPSVRNTWLWRKPQYLVVCLKRFSQDMYGRAISKNEAPVDFPLEWDIQRWVHPEAPTDQGLSKSWADMSPTACSPVHSRTHSGAIGTSPPSPTALRSATGNYELISAIHHVGRLNVGHYVSTCRVDGRWYLFNDGTVTPLGDNWASSYQSSAYVLIYTLR